MIDPCNTMQYPNVSANCCINYTSETQVSFHQFTQFDVLFVGYTLGNRHFFLCFYMLCDSACQETVTWHVRRFRICFLAGSAAHVYCSTELSRFRVDKKIHVDTVQCSILELCRSYDYLCISAILCCSHPKCFLTSAISAFNTGVSASSALGRASFAFAFRNCQKRLRKCLDSLQKSSKQASGLRQSMQPILCSWNAWT